MKTRTASSFIFTVSTLFILLVVVSITSIELFYRTKYKNVISPNVSFWGQDVSGYSYVEFLPFIEYPERMTINVAINSDSYPLSLNDIYYSVKTDENWANIYVQKKDYLKNPLSISVSAIGRFLYINPILSYDKTALYNEIDKISSIAFGDTVFEEIVLKEGSVSFTQGKDGHVLDKKLFEERFLESIYDKSYAFSMVPTPVNSKMSDEKKHAAALVAKSLTGKSIKIIFENKEYEILDTALVATLNDNQVNGEKYINEILNKISDNFNRPAKDSVFVFENGRVTEFTPSETGIKVIIPQLKNTVLTTRDVLSASDKKSVVIDLPYVKDEPKVSTENINNYGIKEKIGSGISYFRGSIPSRIHNIRLASSKFNGVMIAPNETVSFNQTLGDVSKVTGYQQAYIIKDGQTILGDGGGVCQVSTTFFRAALNAGLAITERRGHSYRVSYYEQSSPPGIDATVFDPSTDLKILNNTDNHILIQTFLDEKGNSLIFDLYGTKDGRTVSMSKPVVKDQVSPPEDLYIDDPTLSVGTVKQIDYKAWGAKVYFNYKVEKEGTVIFEKIFYTTYQPWQAKYLKGTGV